jgi:ribosomal protein L16 Arg81 hydroxylase
MNFNTLIKPLSKKIFMEKFNQGTCFVIRGESDKFQGLITLEEIEARLNDGCNLASPVEIIHDGKRQPLVDFSCAWSKIAVKKKDVLLSILGKRSFMMPNSSQINTSVAALIDGIEDQFKKQHIRADLHLYVSPAGGASAYNAHRDYPQHKLYLQVIGSTDWTIYSHDPKLPDDVVAISSGKINNKLKVAGEFRLNPGDLFYMPPSVFHRIANTGGPRVSLSIPFIASKKQKAMDRTFIPFKQIFESQLKVNKSETQ